MKIKLFSNIILLFFCFLSAYAAIDPYQVDPNPPPMISGYTLKWSDEFNEKGKPDNKNWIYETGFIRNHEYQWYQSNNANCSDGLLQIVSKHEQVTNPYYNASSSDWTLNRRYADYTSASINTNGLHSWLYGRFIVRARIPAFNGSWPAIWTLGATGEWPSCGEIDIMEYYDNSILANAAWGTSTQWVAKWKTSKTFLSHFTTSDPDWANKFHVWRMDWTVDYIKLYIDDELLNSIDLKITINADGTNPFHSAQYLLLNLAIGGDSGGDPGQTSFPITYSVDYARVYQESASSLDEIKGIDFRPVLVGSKLYIPNENKESMDISVYELSGKLILNKILGQNVNTIDVSNVKKGVYTIRLSCLGRTKVFKFIMQ